MVEIDKDSGAKGCSEAVSEAKDWEILGVLLEWGSGSIRKKRGCRCINIHWDNVGDQHYDNHWYG